MVNRSYFGDEHYNRPAARMHARPLLSAHGLDGQVHYLAVAAALLPAVGIIAVAGSMLGIL